MSLPPTLDANSPRFERWELFCERDLKILIIGEQKSTSREKSESFVRVFSFNSVRNVLE